VSNGQPVAPGLTDEEIVDWICNERSAATKNKKGARVQAFANSTTDVQQGARNRFNQERTSAK
jgi:hypothetical protein